LAFTSFPESRSALIKNPNKGALWPYIRNIDFYRCPRGRAGHVATYSIISAANGSDTNGRFMDAESFLMGYKGEGPPINRVGRTVLRLIRLTDIISPGAGERAVFIDTGQMPGGFYVPYFYPKWDNGSPPPIHHADGVTLSMADGHAEYWKWKGRETITGLPRMLAPVRDTGLFVEGMKAAYESQTEDGLYDLQRLQRAAWGRLGY